MAGAWTTKSIKDATGTTVSMRVWDESGSGSGPFSFAQVPGNGDGTTAPTAITTLISAANRAKISPSITVTAATYSANQCVGGKLTLSSVNSSSGRSLTIERIVLRSASTTAITATFRVFLFDADPSGSTYTDNGTFNTVAADITKAIGFVDVTLWADGGTSSHASVGDSGPLAIPATPSGTSLYACIQTLGAPVFSGTSNLSMDVYVNKD